MNGYRFFSIYFPLHLHFNTAYDYFKYSGKSNYVTLERYQSRRDKLIFEQYGNYFQSSDSAGNFIIANFIYNNDTWLYEERQHARDMFSYWERINSSLERQFKNDIDVLSQTLETKRVSSPPRLFVKTDKGNVAPIIQLANARQISKECLCLIDAHVYPCLTNWKSDYEHDPLISAEIRKLDKYSRFLYNVNGSKIKSTFMEFLKNHD